MVHKYWYNDTHMVAIYIYIYIFFNETYFNDVFMNQWWKTMWKMCLLIYYLQCTAFQYSVSMRKWFTSQIMCVHKDILSHQKKIDDDFIWCIFTPLFHPPPLYMKISKLTVFFSVFQILLIQNSSSKKKKNI